MKGTWCFGLYKRHISEMASQTLLEEKSDFEELLRLKDCPIRMGVTDELEEKDVFSDMIFEIEKSTGMIQLGKQIPQELLYKNAHYNNIASNWKEHHREFAKLIYKYHPKAVFEIGGGTGLLSCYYNELDTIDWKILESAPNPVEGCRAEYIEGIFDEKYEIKGNYDAVVHSHTMEHFYKPLEVIKNIGRHMPIGSYMFFSIPNLEEMYRRCYTNVLNFEHTYLCVEPYVSVILDKSGYEVLERKLFKDEHSVFYVAKRVEKSCKDFKNLYKECYEKNKMLLLNWAEYHTKLVEKINKELKGAVGEHKIFLFGAHAYAQFLLKFGLNDEHIECVLDNDSAKQGYRLYGTRFKVCSTDILIGEKEPIVILHAGTHDKEIKEGILRKNSTTLFV